MTSFTLTHTQKLSTIECCSCHATFAMTAEFMAEKRDDHTIFYCPAGHQQHFAGKSDLERTKARADRLAQELASQQEDLRIEKIAHASTKGQLTKTRKRAEKGMCLHCHRHFTNVERHVKTRHADQLEALS